MLRSLVDQSSSVRRSGPCTRRLRRAWLWSRQHTMRALLIAVLVLGLLMLWIYHDLVEHHGEDGSGSSSSSSSGGGGELSKRATSSRRRQQTRPMKQKINDEAMSLYLRGTLTMSSKALAKLEARGKVIEEMVLSSWKLFAKACLGYDAHQPLTDRCSLRKGSLALGTFDHLGNLLIVHAKQELEAAINALQSFHTLPATNVSFFALTSRALGSLLSSYELTGRSELLVAIKKLDEKLRPAFLALSTPVPRPFINLNLGKFHASGAPVSLAEFSSFWLEFAYLSRTLNDDFYLNIVEANVEYLFALPNPATFFLPSHIDLVNSRFVWDGTVRVNRDTAVILPTLFKLGVLTGKPEFFARYSQLLDQVLENLLVVLKDGTVIIAEDAPSASIIASTKMYHSACSIPGLLVLDWHFHQQVPTMPPTDLPRSTPRLAKLFRPKLVGENFSRIDLADKLLSTCMRMYNETGTMQLVAEENFFPHSANATTKELVKYYRKHFGSTYNNSLPSETLESLFYLWRTTTDSKYLDLGWSIYVTFQEHSLVHSNALRTLVATKVERRGQVSGLAPSSSKLHFYYTQLDHTPWHVYSATIKFAYLLFKEDKLFPVRDFIFTGSGHILPTHSRQV